MSKAIVLERLGGNLAVVFPAPKRVQALIAAGLSEEQAMRSLAGSAALDGDVIGETVDASDLPGRRFRRAWRRVSGSVLVDMPEARKQRMEEIRAERNERLAETDVRALREQERDGTVSPALRAYRQALRDLPQNIRADVDAVVNEDDLAAYEPDYPQEPANG